MHRSIIRRFAAIPFVMAAIVAVLGLCAAVPFQARAASAPPTPTLSKQIDLGSSDNSSYVLYGIGKDGARALLSSFNYGDDSDVYKSSVIVVDLHTGKRSTFPGSFGYLSEGTSRMFWSDADYSSLYAVDTDANALTRYDVDTGQSTTLGNIDVTGIAEGRTSKDDKLLYMLRKNTADTPSLITYDPQKQQVKSTTTINTWNDINWMVSDDGSTVFTLDYEQGIVKAIDIATSKERFTTTIDRNQYPDYYWYFAAQRNNALILGSYSGSKNVLIRLDTTTGSYTPLISSDDGSTFVTRSNSTILEVIEGDDDLSGSDSSYTTINVYDIDTGKMTSSTNISTPSSGLGIYSTLAVTGNARYLYVAVDSDGDSSPGLGDTITVIDTATGAMSSTPLTLKYINSSSSCYTTADDSQFATVADDFDTVTLLVYDTGVRASIVDQVNNGDMPLLPMVVAVVILLLIIVAIIIIVIRHRRKVRAATAAAASAAVPTPTVSDMSAVPVTSTTPISPAVPMPTQPSTSEASPFGSAVPTPVPSGTSAAVPSVQIPLPRTPETAQSEPTPPQTAQSEPAVQPQHPHFCMFCGQPIANPQARFCPSCGQPLQ